MSAAFLFTFIYSSKTIQRMVIITIIQSLIHRLSPLLLIMTIMSLIILYLLLLFFCGYQKEKGYLFLSTGISIPIPRRHMVVNIVAREQGYKDMLWACHAVWSLGEASIAASTGICRFR